MKYTEQDLKDEYEQAVKRRGKLYADGYVEGLKDAQNQALTIPVVVDSFFTASDVGKEFEILANSSGHGFHIGEIVTLLEINADPDDDEYKFAGKDDYWWCIFADIKTK